MSNHTGPGYWKITNTRYGFAVVDGKVRRKRLYHTEINASHVTPWLAIWVSDNPYSIQAPKRFKTHKDALAYAVLGGTPIPPETLATLEER
jgi:hypothetical protein